VQLVGFCSSFLSSDSIIDIVKIVNESHKIFAKYKNEEQYDTYEYNPKLDRKQFGNFGSYHKKCNRINKYNRNNFKTEFDTDIQPRYVEFKNVDSVCSCSSCIKYN